METVQLGFYFFLLCNWSQSPNYPKKCFHMANVSNHGSVWFIQRQLLVRTPCSKAPSTLVILVQTKLKLSKVWTKQGRCESDLNFGIQFQISLAGLCVSLSRSLSKTHIDTVTGQSGLKQGWYLEGLIDVRQSFCLRPEHFTEISSLSPFPV